MSAIGAHLTLEGGDEIAAPFSEAPEFVAERWLRRGVEMLAAAVVLAEVTILLSGIVARALYNHPIIWSDELASILFLWLAMLGSALAVQRGSHMRLTFFVSMVGPRAQQWAETLAVGATLAFLGIALHPAYEYLQDQAFVETPALGWSGVVRALAIPFGFVMAFASCLLRIIHHERRDVVAIIAIMGPIAVRVGAAK